MSGVILIAILLLCTRHAVSQTCTLTAQQLAIQGGCPVNTNVGTCLGDIYDKSLQCTSNDVPISKVVACVGNCGASASCTAGSTFSATLAYTIQANAQTRYDFGLYVGFRQASAFTGNCCRYMLYPTTTIAAQQNLSGGCGPFLSDAKDKDVCGDVIQNLNVTEFIHVSVPCTADVNSTILSIPYCSVWKNSAGNDCSSVADLVPGTGAKCKCGTVQVENVQVLPSGLTVSPGVGASGATGISSDTCYRAGTTLTTYFTVNNPLSIPLSSVSVTDSLGSSLTCCAVNTSCFPSGSPTTPLPIPSLPGNSYVLCRASYSVPSSTSGTLTNLVTISGQDTRYSPALILSANTSISVLSAAVSVSQSVVQSGSNSAWTLVISNSGSAGITGFSVSSTPSIYGSCSSAAIPAGGSVTCTGTITPTGATCSDSVSVTVSTTVSGGCTASGSDSDSINYNRECRPTNGNVCDVAESCSAGTCPGNSFASNTTQCASVNASNPCDVPDTCDGAGNCPVKWKTNGTSCQNSLSGPCDATDTCDDLGHCLTKNAGAGTRCQNTLSGNCDDYDTCDGNGNCVIQNATAGTTCQDSVSGPCDALDKCDGLGACVPQFASSGTNCQESVTGPCDALDQCDGSGTCVPKFASDETTCQDSVSGPCDALDKCDGSGTCVPKFASNETTCQDSVSGPCDALDKCDGSGNCVPTFASAGTTCQETLGEECDDYDKCDGSGNCDSKFKPNGTPCGNLSGECDKQDFCTGNSNSCPDTNYGSNLCQNITCAPATCSDSAPHTCLYDNQDSICGNSPNCTRDICVGNLESLILQYGPPAADGCVHVPDSSKCRTCTCTSAVCLPTNSKAWSDGCVHSFGNGGTQLAAGDESKATCT